MKRNKICLLALAALLFTPAVIQTVNIATAEETVVVNPADVEKIQIVKDQLTLNADLNNITSPFYLPSKSLYDSRIEWKSSNRNVIRITDNSMVIIRPSAEKEAATCTITANITLGTATESKEFECRVLPVSEYKPTTSTTFVEDYSNYKLGQDLANYLIWEHSGDEIATVEEEVLDNNMVGNRVLDFNPLATLYKDTSYKTKITTSNKFVFETHAMTTGSISGFRFELLEDSSKAISLGLDYDENGNPAFIAYNPATGLEEVLAPRDNGVWYKLRLEVDMDKSSYHAYYYDWKNNGELVRLTPSDGIRVEKESISYFRMRVLTGRNDGRIFVAPFTIDESANLPAEAGTNPNRSKGIGYIENYVESYLLVENEEFSVPEFTIYNRFNKEETLIEGTDYTIEKVYGSTGEVTTSIVGDYQTYYTITLTTPEGQVEVKKLTQTFHVDPSDATADLSNLRIAPIVNDSNPNAEKVLKITASINRKDSYVYYAAVDQGAGDLTAQEVYEASKSNIKFAGHEKINDSKFQINVHGLEAGKEYDFYVITKNDNGISSTYIKRNISISVYNIEDPEDFFFMCTDPEVQTTSFRLLNDIDFADYYWAASEITRPEYTGTFDGQGFTIRNLTIVAPFKKASLFYDFAGTFKNLTMENCSLTGNESVGFIGGYAKGQATVDNIRLVNCEVKCYSSSSAGDGYYGLIFGRAEGGSSGGNIKVNNVSMENCYVEAPKYAGAIAGNIQKISSLSINNVYCQVVMKGENAAFALLSRIRSGVTVSVKNTYVDVDIIYAKKEVACIAGHLEDTLILENVVGKLRVQGLTQNTYWNTVTGRYGTSAHIEYKNCFFFKVDTSLLSEDTLTPNAASLHVGTYLNQPKEFTKEWWERNTCFSNLDTNPIWGYSEELKTPYLRSLDLTTLSFTAEEVNYYIDLIGDEITSSDRYYIKKAYELLEYVSDSEKANVKLDVLEQAKADYEHYCSAINNSTDVADKIGSSITSGIDWNYEERSEN